MSHAQPAPAAIQPPEQQLPFLSALKIMMDNPMEGWPRAMYEEPVYVHPRRDFPIVYLCEPNAIRSVLVEHVEDFPKAPLWHKLLKPMLGEGLLTSEGAAWRWQRQAAAPAFQPKHLMQFAPVIAAAADRAARRWRAEPGERTRDMSAEFIRITFEIILDTMLGGKGEHDIDAMSAHFARYLHDLGKPSLIDVLGAPDWVRRFTAPGARAAVAYMRNAADAMIARRRQSPPGDDLMQALMDAQDPETGRRMSDADVRDNLLTFLAGGHETTALALTWTVHLLTCFPDVQRRVREEVAQAVGSGPISAEALPRLQFTKQVVQETLRLYPQFPAISRVCKREVTLAARAIKPGEIVVIPIYALHRHSLYWDEPNKFDPDRFEPGAGLDRRRYVYMPFGGGPRVCIGAAFAMMEIVILLASLVRAASFSAVSAEPVRPLLRITMRPEGGLPVQVSPLH